MSQKKRESRGYTPALIEELDMPISGNALQLLLRLRRDSDMRETDGFLTNRQLDALAVAHGISKTVKRKALGELVSVGLVHQTDTGFIDFHFDQWCRTSAERKGLREKWNAAKREPKSGSTMESAMDSTQDSTRTASASASTSVSIAAASNGLPANSEGATTQADAILLAETWKDVSGKPVGVSETSHIGWWLTTYDRLAASQIADTMRRIATRPGQEPIGRISYFDSILREQNDASRPSRTDGATPAEPYVERVAIGEPPPWPKS